MSIELPAAISRYLTADQDKDPDAVSRCFIEGATVRDEGQSYRGVDAIRQWKSASSTKYNYTVEPISIGSDGDRRVVTCHLKGDFPGSPTDLRYFFRLEGDRISDLEIIQ